MNSAFNSEMGVFECNICLELAHDPIVTPCGHLYCWPCLYQWLHSHSRSRKCPVCRARVQDEKLVPIYGRGKVSSDLSLQSVPSDAIPNRATGRRLETAPARDTNLLREVYLNRREEFTLMGTRYNSSSLFNLHPLFDDTSSLFNLHPLFDDTSGDPFLFHGRYGHRCHRRSTQRLSTSNIVINMCLFFLSLLMVFFLF